MFNSYKYETYRVYSFFEKKDNTPIGDTVIVMCLVHSFQILTAGLYLALIFNWSWFYLPKSRSAMVCDLAAIM